MTQKDFNAIVTEQVQRSLDCLTTKGKEYAKEQGDRLQSFKTAAGLLACGSAKALCGMMAKHTVSIFEMCENPEAYTLDKWNEKITDSINYLLILRAIVQEEQDNA